MSYNIVIKYNEKVIPGVRNISQVTKYFKGKSVPNTSVNKLNQLIRSLRSTQDIDPKIEDIILSRGYSLSLCPEKSNLYTNSVKKQLSKRKNKILSYSNVYLNVTRTDIINFNKQVILNDNTLDSFIKIISDKLMSYKRKEHKISYYLISIGQETDEGGIKYNSVTTFANINDVMTQLRRHIQDVMSYYDSSYAVKKAIIYRREVPRIPDRLVYGSNNTHFLENFLKNIKNNNDDIKRNNYIKKIKKLMDEYHIISPKTNNRCIITAFLMSFYQEENVKKRVDKLCEKLKIPENLMTIKHVCGLLIKEKHCNIKVIDLSNFDEEIFSINNEEDYVTIGIFGSHSYGLIEMNDEEYDNEIDLDNDEQEIIEIPEYKNKYEDYKICTYDCETCDDKDNQCHTYAIGFYDGVNYKSFFEYKYADVVNSFIQYICSDKCPKKLIIYGHNSGKFDMWLIIKKIMEKYGLHITNFLCKDGRIINIIAIGQQKSIVFRDTFCFVACSLDAACKSFDTKTKKLTGDVDHDKINMNNCKTIKIYDYVKNYLEADCKSLREIVIKINKTLIDNYDFSIKSVLTNAAIARKVFLTTYYEPERYPIYKLSEDVDFLFRKHYFGGRNECLTKLGLFSKVYYYDFTSLYPYCMLFEYPYGKMYIEDADEYDEDKFGFYRVKVRHTKNAISKKEVPYLCSFENGKLIFPYYINWKEMILTTEQIKYIKKNKLGYEFRFLTCYYYKKKGNIFDKMINQLYKMKQEAGRDKKPALKSMAKTIINSAYGFWGINFDKEQVSIKSEKSKEKNIAELNDYLTANKLIDHKEFGKYQIYRYSDKLDIKCANLGIAMFVTAYARTKLYDLIKNINTKGGTVYYCDTDSVICNHCIETDKELNKKYMTGGGDVLGNLKNEIHDFGGKDYYFDKFINIGCKTYGLKKEIEKDIIKEQIKFKGVNTKNKYNKKIIDNDKKTISLQEINKNGKYKFDFSILEYILKGYNIIVDNMSLLSSVNILFGNKEVTKRNNNKNLKMNYTKALLNNMNITPLSI